MRQPCWVGRDTPTAPHRPYCLLLQILVVANPANTNALMLKEHAPSIPAENITALTRLDHNRALAQVRKTTTEGGEGGNTSSTGHQLPTDP